MPDEHSLDVLARVHADASEVPVILGYWDILMIFEAATMTITHPNVTEYTKTYYTQLAKQLEARLLEEFPELTDLCRMCWNRQLFMTDDPLAIERRKNWVDGMTKRYMRKTGRL